MADSNNATVLSISGLRYERNDRKILKGVDWRVGAGEHWVILGPNGCGKTSLINCLTGYEMSTAGDIMVDGAEFGRTDWREVRKRVGLVTSTLTFYLEPGEPVLDAVASGREAMLNLVGEVSAEVRAEARALLERIGCGYLADSFWGVLSQGERQKILICRALMSKYHVLILDEPCAGLDPVAREHFLGWLQQLATAPGAPSMVLVTHHVEEILPCFTHVLVLKQGAVLAAGTKQDVLTSERLSEAYGAPLSLEASGDRYRLTLLSSSSR
ncbi:ATP-binding cassette domain-containing protein [Roseimicrobium sp. ORNL1]|nr:ATP-binding cassette domain-containing protein [Roseimicrobium sp. ORNL1]